MDGWAINFSPGNHECDCCHFDVETGYMLGQHPNWPGEWMCLQCVLNAVRTDIRSRALQGGVRG